MESSLLQVLFFTPLGGKRRGGGRGPKPPPRPHDLGPPLTSPLRLTALGAGMRQSRDLTSGAGVPSSPRALPCLPAGSPRSLVWAPQRRGGGVRFATSLAAGGRFEVLTTPLPCLPPPAALPCSCSALAALRRRGRSGGERGRPCAGLGPGPAAAPPSTHSEPAARGGAGGGPVASSRSDLRPPARDEGDGARLRRGGGGGSSSGGPRFRTPRPIGCPCWEAAEETARRRPVSGRALPGRR